MEPQGSTQARLGEGTAATRTVPGGVYITFEGPDGCGKSTQLRLLAERLRGEGWRVVATKQPGGTEAGAAIRQVLLNRKYTDKLQAKTESLLFWADRHEHHQSIVKPALAEGCVVLGDRDFDSSWAYQHWGRGIERDWMAAAHKLSVGSFLPEKTLLFDGPVRDLLRRSKEKNAAFVRQHGKAADESRFEYIDVTFHERVREGFLARAKAEPLRFVMLDAMKSVHELHEDVYRVVAELLGQR